MSKRKRGGPAPLIGPEKMVPKRTRAVVRRVGEEGPAASTDTPYFTKAGSLWPAGPDPDAEAIADTPLDVAQGRRPTWPVSGQQHADMSAAMEATRSGQRHADQLHLLHDGEPQPPARRITVPAEDEPSQYATGGRWSQAVTGPDPESLLGTSAPPVHTAADVAELRNWLVRQWQPGGTYHSLQAVQRRSREYLDAERVQLQRADLYWVHPTMVQLLATVAPSTPGDTKPTDLPWPAPQGLVVFATPLVGTDAARPGIPVQVDAIVWGQTSLPAHPRPGRVQALTVSSYRLLDFDAGLTPEDLALAMGTGAMSHGRRGANVTSDEGAATFYVHGTTWAPLGRSDWPLGDTLDTQPYWLADDFDKRNLFTPDGVKPAGDPADWWASFREDRATIAALFTLLAQAGVASQAQAIPERHVRKRAQRIGVATPDRPVVVVTLRNPRAPQRPTEGEPGHVTHDHRWVVREHLRWQACGPGRTERRLTMVRAHTKGPADAPLLLKTRVNAWVR